MPVGLTVLVGLSESVPVGVMEGERPAESVDVDDGVLVAEGVAEGVAEHESGTLRPVVVHPHAHSKGAEDARGQ